MVLRNVCHRWALSAKETPVVPEISSFRLGQSHETTHRDVPKRSSQYELQISHEVCTILTSCSVSLAGCPRFIDPKHRLLFLSIASLDKQTNRNSSNSQLSANPL